MKAQMTATTVCFHYAADGTRCRVQCLDPAAFCCPIHLHEYQHTPTDHLLTTAAELILDSTRFTKQGLPFLACTKLQSWKRLCNALWALSCQGYHDAPELLTLLVSSIESIRGPWQGKSPLTRKGKSFERLVTRLYLEELSPLVHAKTPDDKGVTVVRVLWDEKLPLLPGGRGQIDVLLRQIEGGEESLTVVECRDHEVEVGEMRDFATLIRHVGASKGVLVSSAGFQKGAESCARFEGIETRIVTEEDFAPESVERIVEQMYAFEPLMVHIEPPNGRPPVPLNVAAHLIYVVRNGVIAETLADLVNSLVCTAAPTPGTMPPRLDVMTPAMSLLLPNGTYMAMAALHIPVKIIERSKRCTLLLPRRPLSFRVRKLPQGSARKIAASSVPLFATPCFEAGRFYVNLLGQAYYCEAVDPAATVACCVLLRDQQHPERGPIDIEFAVGFDQADHYYRVEDPEAVKVLQIDLARFQSIRVPR